MRRAEKIQPGPNKLARQAEQVEELFGRAVSRASTREQEHAGGMRLFVARVSQTATSTGTRLRIDLGVEMPVVHARKFPSWHTQRTLSARNPSGYSCGRACSLSLEGARTHRERGQM